MHIDPADASTVEPLSLDEPEELTLLDHWRPRQGCQKVEHLASVPKVPAGKLANCERMDDSDPTLQIVGQPWFTLAKVLDPDRRIDDHAEARRLRGDERVGSEPPRAASRRALSRSTKAWRPAWTNAVFSSIPVAWRASSIRSSRRFSVVRICFSMHERSASSKSRGRHRSSTLEAERAF